MMTAEQTKRRQLWIGLGIALALSAAVCCGVGILLLRRATTPTVTASMQQAAVQALANPGSAQIDLGNYAYADWYPPSGTDYAVESGVVIFPQPIPINRIQDAFDNIVGDKYMQALVYAPDGRTLPMNASPREDRGWFYIGEWELYNCSQVRNQQHWWLCTLVVGGNI